MKHLLLFSAFLLVFFARTLSAQTLPIENDFGEAGIAIRSPDSCAAITDCRHLYYSVRSGRPAFRHIFHSGQNGQRTPERGFVDC